MRERPRMLPDFTAPPIVEVGLAVQFEPLNGLTTAQLGLLWQDYRDRYPRAEDHPQQPASVERFGTATLLTAGVQFQITEYLPPPCLWMLDAPGTRLVQVQRDRFAVNWRGEGSDYPRYESVRERFFTELGLFRSFLEANSLPNPEVTQGEITYVNHVLPNAVWSSYGDAGRVFSTIDPEAGAEFLPPPEHVRLASSYIIPDDAGAPLGRLHFSVEPGRRAKAPVLVATLTVRGAPDDGSDDQVGRFLDIGHEWIVRGFAALTRPDVQAVWGRKQ